LQNFFIHHLAKKELSNLQINFTKFLTKKDKSILLLFKNSNHNRYLEIDKKVFLERKIYSSYDELNSSIFLDLIKLKEKNIIISYENKPITYISIISSFYIDEDFIGISFSYEFFTSFSENSFFNKLNLNYILNFKERHTHLLYQKFILENKQEFILDVEELKNLFNLNNKNYSRFYDFEKNILLPIIDDINNNSILKVEYEKVRASEHKNSKILKLRFICFLNLQNNNIINHFLNLIKDRIENIDNIYKEIKKVLTIQGKEYIQERIDYALQINPKNFEDFLLKILSLDNYKKDLVIFKKSQKFSSLFELHSFILKVIKELHNKNIAINFEVFSVQFLSKIFFLKSDKVLQYHEKKHSFYLDYKLNGESTLLIKQHLGEYI
jgi:hypothetical protein